MVNDHLSDFITRVRNGYMAKRPSIDVPLFKVTEKVAEVLVKEGYAKAVEKKDGVLVVELKYDGKDPAVMGIRRVSTPGARIYCKVHDIPKVWGGLGMNILSTPKGIMSEKEARKLNCGGEVLAQIW